VCSGVYVSTDYEYHKFQRRFLSGQQAALELKDIGWQRSRYAPFLEADMSQRKVVVFLCLTLLAGTVKADGKKHLIVVADNSQRQVNNHPWSYTSPGQANTNCSGTANVSATATNGGSGTTNVNGTITNNTDCNATYVPPQTTRGNWVTVDNASWVTDIATGDQYLIQCTAHWRGSKCSYLTGGRYEADLEGNSMWITGMKGMKEAKSKYQVLQFVPSMGTSISSPTPSQLRQPLTESETYAVLMYQVLDSRDRDYVRTFCSGSPNGSALLPRSKVDAGLSADHALNCTAWLSAKTKGEVQ
jgi:hypothetical protein